MVSYLSFSSSIVLPLPTLAILVLDVLILGSILFRPLSRFCLGWLEEKCAVCCGARHRVVVPNIDGCCHIGENARSRAFDGAFILVEALYHVQLKKTFSRPMRLKKRVRAEWPLFADFRARES